jgi:two-component system phosphate regulon sensor histidine kinase PhoR
LVDNLLESASIEIGHFRVSPCSTDLAQIIAECVRIMHPLIDKHEQTINVALPGSLPQVQADPKRIAQVMINLLSNANKYSPDRTEIFLSAKTTDELIRVSVANRGTGIPAERHKSIFQRFSQLDQINNDTQGGAGLGLSVVKAIVEAHGGEVGVEDHPGGGSVFWFTLPMADRE